MDLYEKIKRNPHNVTPKELIELLEHYKFKLRNTTGSHEVYKRSGFDKLFTIPTSKNPLTIGIVKDALRLI